MTTTDTKRISDPNVHMLHRLELFWPVPGPEATVGKFVGRMPFATIWIASPALGGTAWEIAKACDLDARVMQFDGIEHRRPRDGAHGFYVAVPLPGDDTPSMQHVANLVTTEQKLLACIAMAKLTTKEREAFVWSLRYEWTREADRNERIDFDVALAHAKAMDAQHPERRQAVAVLIRDLANLIASGEAELAERLQLSDIRGGSKREMHVLRIVT